VLHRREPRRLHRHHSLDWLFPLGDINEAGYPHFIAEVGAVAMGSSTFEWMPRHVIRPEGRAGAPWPYAQPASFMLPDCSTRSSSRSARCAGRRRNC